MGWPAVWRFGVLAVVACVHHDEPRGPIANHIEAAPIDVAGAYWCSIDEAGFRYGRMPCVIKKIGDQLVLAKLGGSQRFTGVVTPVGDGLKFDGRLYCPWGECNAPLHGEFKPGADHELQGRFKEDAMLVTLVPASAGAFGAGVGGESYGGDGYGGDPWSLAR